MDWLPQSCRQKQPPSKEEVLNVLQETWETTSEDYLKLWLFTERVRAVLKNKIGHNKYWLLSMLELCKLSSYCPFSKQNVKEWGVA